MFPWILDTSMSLVHCVGRDAMVLLDDGVEHVGEHLVGVPVARIDAAVLVVEINSAGDRLAQGESAGGSLDGAQLLPDRLSHILGHKTVLGFNIWEGVGHVGACIRRLGDAALADDDWELPM